MVFIDILHSSWNERGLTRSHQQSLISNVNAQGSAMSMSYQYNNYFWGYQTRHEENAEKKDWEKYKINVSFLEASEY